MSDEPKEESAESEAAQNPYVYDNVFYGDCQCGLYIPPESDIVIERNAIVPTQEEE